MVQKSYERLKFRKIVLNRFWILHLPCQKQKTIKVDIKVNIRYNREKMLLIKQICDQELFLY